MPPGIATLTFAAGILGLFFLDRDPKARTSKALWIAVIWLSIAGSRSVGQWIATLHGHSITDAASAESAYTEGSPTDRLAYSGLLLAGLIVLARRRQEVLGILRLNWPLAAFFLYCAVSIAWSDYPDVAFKRWIKALGDVVMVLIVLTDRDRYAAIKRVLAWTGFLLIPLSVLFIEFYPDLAGISPVDLDAVLHRRRHQQERTGVHVSGPGLGLRMAFYRGLAQRAARRQE